MSGRAWDSGAAAVAKASAPALLGWLRARESEMVSLLLGLARAESPSDDPAAQTDVHARIAAELVQLGHRVHAPETPTGGRHLISVPVQRPRGARAQLLVGHLDTVWPVGTLDRMPATVGDGVVRGPGVYDMKAGIVQGLFALRALRQFGLEPPAVPVVLVVCDEEVGSRDGARHVLRLARRAVRAFVLEPSFGPAGALKTRRKSVGRFQLVVHGRAAHAGIEPERGISAIQELSRQIQALFELNDPERGVTVNVGTIDGGLRANVVAPEARATVEARVPTDADGARIEAAILGLQPELPGVRLEVAGGFGRPALEATPRNARLWERAAAHAAALGLDLDQAAVGGASDGNTTSAYTATLDGLGAVGDGAHAAHEQVVAAAMAERAALLTLLLMDPVEEP
ncbi:MAG: M20/M25/M40 family metallo-hydrolase [Actinobacteria bacterium]|nr:M20/M25/M40 family metallo-hydrolase [Thermoleophilia bacterium]MCB9010360.1 M20/M25/M40 family metallo-hydrolase [Actinomycetota bacterium]